MYSSSASFTKRFTFIIYQPKKKLFKICFYNCVQFRFDLKATNPACDFDFVISIFAKIKNQLDMSLQRHQSLFFLLAVNKFKYLL
jgi:hypothetical protein